MPLDPAARTMLADALADILARINPTTWRELANPKLNHTHLLRELAKVLVEEIALHPIEMRVREPRRGHSSSDYER